VAKRFSRSQLIRGRLAPTRQPIRPPWESNLENKCDQCGECIKHCPESILIQSADGFPEVDFRRGECTFCGECADVCKPKAILKQDNQIPWYLDVSVSSACLGFKSVSCRSCGDVCADQAIEFRITSNGIGIPTINNDLCNSCGGCLSVCPVDAIQIIPAQERALIRKTAE